MARARRRPPETQGRRTEFRGYGRLEGLHTVCVALEGGAAFGFEVTRGSREVVEKNAGGMVVSTQPIR